MSALYLFSITFQLFYGCPVQPPASFMRSPDLRGCNLLKNAAHVFFQRKITLCCRYHQTSSQMGMYINDEIAPLLTIILMLHCHSYISFPVDIVKTRFCYFNCFNVMLPECAAYFKQLKED